MSLRTRLRQEVEDERHDRWLVSYADFITLLFAFFVVMYAVSSVNDGKYRVLSDSLESAFRVPLTSLLPIDLGGGVRTGEGGDQHASEQVLQALGEAISEMEEAALEFYVAANDAAATPPPDMPIRNIEEATDYLNARLENVVDESQFSVRQGDGWLQIELQSELMFASGSANLQQGSGTVLAEIAPVLTGMPGEVRVEGFTDDVPIANLRFPSNWELSAARAGSIVRFFESRGVESSRLAAVGYGENQPVADNANADGRRRNRRVVISIAADPQLQLVEDLLPPALMPESAGTALDQAPPPGAAETAEVLVLRRVTGWPAGLPVR